MAWVGRSRGLERISPRSHQWCLAHGNMLVGVWKDALIVRLGPDEGGEALLEPDSRKSSHPRSAQSVGLFRHGDETFAAPHDGASRWMRGMIRSSAKRKANHGSS